MLFVARTNYFPIRAFCVNSRLLYGMSRLTRNDPCGKESFGVESEFLEVPIRHKVSRDVLAESSVDQIRYLFEFFLEFFQIVEEM